MKNRVVVIEKKSNLNGIVSGKTVTARKKKLEFRQGVSAKEYSKHLKNLLEYLKGKDCHCC